MKKRKTCVTLFATDYISKSITTHASRHNNVHILLPTSSFNTVTEKLRLDFRQGQKFFSHPQRSHRLWGPQSSLTKG